MKLKKKLISLAVSLVLLGILFWRVDRQALLEALSQTHIGWMTVALFLFIPQTFAIAWRWTKIASPLSKLSVREAGRQVMAASCLNLFLPSKAGDLAKGIFLHHQGKCTLKDGLQYVVFEKLLDLAALSLIMLVSSLFFFPESWILRGVLVLGLMIVLFVWGVYFSSTARFVIEKFVPSALKENKIGQKIFGLVHAAPEIMSSLCPKKVGPVKLTTWTVGIWVLHLLQILCFFKALGIEASSVSILVKMPMAIFSGLLPLTVAGFGIRDWTIIALFQGPQVTMASLVAVGVLFSSRYIIPAIAGLPFAPRYYHLAKEHFQKNRENSKT